MPQILTGRETSRANALQCAIVKYRRESAAQFETPEPIMSRFEDLKFLVTLTLVVLCGSGLDALLR
ncbi:hypothetical protein [Methylobacterium gregans]|uniref:hypothetical protein n=1 Tax=Methylobacterium gregans TaxID=374424 RepID=UPI001EE17FF8|nr:hypothetical protein [Methylobacterium gregans]MDQ0520953.1 hypothetical protein [Methylobacterium gregans]